MTIPSGASWRASSSFSAAAMASSCRPASSTLLPQLESHATSYNKLACTFTAQMEALRKHRSGGQKKVTVEHVHVRAGGQAIVGDVHHGGRGAEDAR